MTTDTYIAPPHGWTCFHCGETFTDVDAARLHFGVDQDYEPGCVARVPDEERELLRKIGEQEAELDRYRAEDSDKDREMAALRSDHTQALVREEEKGYAKAVGDSRQQFADTLRKHWLWQIECHHDTKTDTPRCSCSMWACDPQPSVGQAVERWIEHVLEQMDVA